jgi:molecular chaperone IbpA
MKTNLSIFNQLRPITIGFDNIFDHFERVLDGDVMNIPTVNYPPYNIVRTGENTYDIELALAGFSKDDIDVEYENNVLTVKSIKREETEKEINDAILHRGISKRMFTKSFTVADDVEVNGAELKDGLLRVSLERIIPESKKPRTIEIK